MKLDKKSIVYNALQDMGTGGVILFFTGGTSIQSFNLVAFLIIAALLIGAAALALAWEYLVWKNYDFYIKEENINIRHGVFRKKSREIPLSRIQNVDIKKNIIQRVLGIAQVNLETAGGGQTEASLKFIGETQAGDIQRKIRNLKKGIEEEDETDEDRELVYEISSQELAVLGLASVKGRLIFGFLGLLGVAGGFIGSVFEQSGLGIVIGLSILAVFGLAAVWIASFANVILKYYDFKLWKSDDSLEYERGLLNRSEGSIPLGKIQKVTLEENPLKRLLEYSTLKIETAGYSAQNAMEGPESAIPLTKRDRAIRLANRIEKFGEIDMVPIPGKARRRYFGRYMIINTVIASGSLVYAYFVPGSYWISGAIFAALTGVSGLAAHMKWKNKGYQVGEDKVLTMNGFWNRKTMVVPYYRIQNLIEVQTIFQRRWDLSSLVLDIAGTNMFQKDARISDLDTEELGEVKDECYQNFLKSLKAQL